MILKSSPLKQESYFLECGDETLHLKRFYIDSDGETVLLLHGSIEDGRIYYSKSGKGLAPFLARQGFDVFVPDLSGKGQSKPPVSKHSKHGQTEAITLELPLFLSKVKALKGDKPQHWMGHSWGGTLLYAYLLRFPNTQKVVSMCQFGVKRRITVWSLRRLFILNFCWHFLGTILTKIYGYMPSKEYNFGSENESLKFYQQINPWFKKKHWVDDDGFDYSAQIPTVNLPPSRFFSGKKDNVLGALKDSKLLIKELQIEEKSEIVFLSKQNGNLDDYDHISMLTSKHCEKDHFPKVAEWMKRF